MRHAVFLALLTCELLAPGAAGSDASAPAVPLEDYALYDLAVTRKFLTSGTRLVVIERMTVPRLSPRQDGPLTFEFVQELGVFDGDLPPELVRNFVAANQDSVRLEGRFQFGVRYRFVTRTGPEEPEVALGYPAHASPVAPVQAEPVLERLAFSCAGRTLRNDQALLYVEQNRPDGSGAGFLLWYRREGLSWTIFDTDVLWTVRSDDPQDDAPPLAP